MRTFSPPLTLATFAFGMGAIALLAQQNATLISLQFFNITLLSLPLGLILTFGIMTGLLLALLFQSWLSRR